MIDAALASTPSASMLNSSLAHQHRQKSLGEGEGGGRNGGWGCVRGCHFPRISKQSSGEHGEGWWGGVVCRGGMREGKKISLIHSVSPQRSEGIAGVKPNETDSSPARRSRAEIKNAPVIQTFTRKTTENSFVPPQPQQGPGLPGRR